MGSAPEDHRLGAGLLQVLRLLPAVSLTGTVGRIVEGGTHAHLLARGGLYEQLYEVQAEGYR